MPLLHSGPVAETLERLHREAEATDGAFMADVMSSLEDSGTTMEEMAANMIAEERADYHAVYRGYAGNFLNVSQTLGQFLYAMARARNARRIVEFGTSMGISAIYLAAALRDNGGGHFIGTELEPVKVERARANIDAAGLSDLVDIRAGDALETLKDVQGEVDMVLIDGAFALYLPILRLIEPALAPGAVILGENAFDPDYLAYVRDPANGYISQSLPVDDGRGNEFSVRVR